MQNRLATIFLFLTAMAVTGTAGYPEAQPTTEFENLFIQGISVTLGAGNFAVSDEVVSKNVYSGILPYFGMSWTRFHSDHAFKVGFEFRQSTHIKNYSRRAEITQFSIHRSWLYPLGNYPFLSKKALVYIGPMTEFYFFFNQPRLEGDGLMLDFSLLSLLSLGIDSDVIIPLSPAVQLEGSLRLALFSFGIQMPEVEEAGDGSEERAGLLNAANGMNVVSDCGFRYRFNSSISMRLSYGLPITLISKWRRFVAASDNLMISISVHF